MRWGDLHLDTAIPYLQLRAEQTKMGCEKGKEVWNADEGKCVPGTPKKRTAKPGAKKKAKDKE